MAALLGGWLGYQLQWIRQRHASLASYSEPDCLEPGFRCRAPLSLALLGEPAYRVLVFEWAVPREQRTRARYQELERLFPEAHIDSARQVPWIAEP